MRIESAEDLKALLDQEVWTADAELDVGGSFDRAGNVDGLGPVDVTFRAA